MQLYKPSTKEYVDITTLSGIAYPNNIVVKNNSSSPIYILSSVSQPLITEEGHPCGEGEILTIPQESGKKVWIRADTFGPIFISSSFQAISKPTIVEFPRELLSASSNEDFQYLRVVTLPRQESLVATGDYYVSTITLTGLAPTSARYYVIESGNVPMVIETVVTTVDFTGITAGRVDFRLEAYVDGSNINTWSVTGETLTDPGRNLNATMINKVPSYTVKNVASATVTGTPDYLIDFAICVNNGAGVNTTQTALSAPLLTASREILLPANTRLLLKSGSVGTGATGTYGLIGVNGYSELPVLV